MSKLSAGRMASNDTVSEIAGAGRIHGGATNPHRVPHARHGYATSIRAFCSILLFAMFALLALHPSNASAYPAKETYPGCTADCSGWQTIYGAQPPTIVTVGPYASPVTACKATQQSYNANGASAIVTYAQNTRPGSGGYCACDLVRKDNGEIQYNNVECFPLSGVTPPSLPVEYSCTAGGVLSGATCSCPSPMVENALGNGCVLPGLPLDFMTAGGDPARPQSCMAGDVGPSASQAGDSAGNPIIPATGEKVLSQVDYTGEGPHPLGFVRTFRSSLALSDTPTVTIGEGLGQGWLHNHMVVLTFDGPTQTDGTTARIRFGDGTVIAFVRNGGGWLTANSADLLTVGVTGWVYKRLEDSSLWRFDDDGKLVQQAQINGWTYSYTYSTAGTTSSVAPIEDLLTSVTNQFTRTLSFQYDSDAALASVSTPDGQTISFSYDDTTFPPRLSTVTYPGSLGGTVSKTYVYENPTFTQAITGIVDESGNRLASYAYDGVGRGISTQYAGGADLYTVNYGTSTSVATVTDPLGVNRSYVFGTAFGKLAVEGDSLPTGNAATQAASRTQDGSGLVTQETDFLGVNTSYTWDFVRRLPLARTLAAGLTETQTISTTWHDSLTLPLLTTQTGRTTAYSYDSLGNKLTESVIDTVTGITRTWAWSYNAQGLAATETAPNGATTQFVYDSLGNLGTSTNALGHTTTMAYDSGGRITQMTAPTGLTTTYAYDPRGRMLAQSVGGLTSTFAYRPTGLVGTATLPSGYRVSYNYDNAQRLTGWQDNRNAQGSYTLDAMGNRTIEQIKDGAGNTAWQLARSINSVNNVVTQTMGTTTAATLEAYGYNANADRTSQANGLSQSTRYGLDALKRTIAITDPANATATLAYNALDAVVAASDFKGVTTTYARDALGNATQESTPDAGTSTTSYNSLGLPQTVIDSLGQASSLTYDLLGRPTQIRFADGKTTTLSYDLSGSSYNAPGAPDASKGYLSQVSDRSGSTSYQRDIFGRVVQKTQALPNSSTQQVTYSFTASGQAGTTTYPSGNQLANAYNSAGQLTTLTWNGTPLITNLQWTPLGQPGTWTWAFSNNGGTDMAGKRSYDTAGRVTATELNTYSYDAAGRITALTQQLYAPTDTNPANSGITQTTASWTAGYDATGRLTSFIESSALTTTTGPGTSSFSYDSNGNRLGSLQTATAGTSTISTARTYAVTSGTNKLQGYNQITQTSLGSSTASISYTYNAAGDITNEGSKTFSFNAESRLSSMANGSTGTSPTTYYTHNALGQRVFKTEPITGTPTTSDNGYAFVYDKDGNLLGEYGTGGASSTGSIEYIWVPTPNGPMPIAAVINGGLFAIHSDNLNTPRRLSNTSTVAVWQWKYSAFGDEQPTIAANRFADLNSNPNPGTTSVASVTFNLRYSGQYADTESGLNYNYFRSYDSNSGRYTQADPIGLDGGWNRFGYVEGDALSFVDPEGLQARPPRGTGAIRPMFPPLGTPPATSPVGNSRVPIEIRPGTNAPGEIGGRPFSGHSFDRMQGRGIPPSAVANTILTGQRSPGSSPGTTQHYDPVNNITVIVNSRTGNVISVRNGPPRNSCTLTIE